MNKRCGIPLRPLQLGQVWKLEDSNVQIGLVGKLLVHYKHFKGKKPVRVPTSLTGIRKLEHFLLENKAILVTP